MLDVLKKIKMDLQNIDWEQLKLDDYNRDREYPENWSNWYPYILDFGKFSTVDIVSNQIADISALTNLTNLTGLYMGRNQIKDIRALSGMTNLRYLSMFENHVEDISPLSGLTNLTSLYLSTNQISDIGAGEIVSLSSGIIGELFVAQELPYA